eukprot:18352-Heterococcus_DN1.PRE.2
MSCSIARTATYTMCNGDHCGSAQHTAYEHQTMRLQQLLQLPVKCVHIMIIIYTVRWLRKNLTVDDFSAD